MTSPCDEKLSSERSRELGEGNSATRKDIALPPNRSPLL